jgi:hypothetical protein
VTRHSALNSILTEAAEGYYKKAEPVWRMLLVQAVSRGMKQTGKGNRIRNRYRV